MANTRTKRWLLGLGAVVVVAILVGLGRLFGQAQSTDPATVHSNAIVVDGHVHITNRVYWEGIDPWKVQSTGLWDFARAKQGGLDVVVEQVYLEDPFNNYNYAVKQACRLIETFYRVLEANRDKMELALNPGDIRRIVAGGKMAVVLALEGGFDTEGDLDVLRLFHRLGVRLIQFTSHDTTNAFVDAGRSEPRWGGITEHGKAVVREMNRLGIVIDISHASDAAQLQIIETSRAPVVASHHGLRHFSTGPRSLSDEALKAMAAKGGLVGIHSSAGLLSQKFTDWARTQPEPARIDWLKEMTRSPDRDYGQYIAKLDAEMRANWTRDAGARGGTGLGRPWRERQKAILDAGGPLPTVDDWADHVDYAVKLVGDEHVGIGLDMIAGGANMRDFDATSYPRFTETLLARGHSQARVRKILGENWLRLFDNAKPAPAGE